MRVQPAVEEMSRSFNNYDAFRKELDPSASKATYQKFLGSMQKQKA